MRTAKTHLATMYVEGVRVSGRALTLAELRRAFEVGFDTGREPVEGKKRRRKS